MLELVNTIEDLVKNVTEYQRAIDISHAPHRRRGRITPSLVRAWYYIPALNMVGPSRFIGYKGMNRERYEQSSEIDGKETELHLHEKAWFRQLLEGEPYYYVARQLAERLNKNREVHADARFYVLKDI